MYHGLILDLDDTLVDTSSLASMRDRRDWHGAVARVHRTRLYPGVAELGGKLAARGIPWAIVTTSVSFYAERVLAYHDLEPDFLVAFHDAPPKPSPEPVQLVLAKWRMSPTLVAGVGDRETDLLAYRAAQVTAVGAGWSPALELAQWELTVRSASDLLEALAAHFEGATAPMDLPPST